ncbi:hypothetical protein D3C80_1983310 [compost metagenome]
MCSDRGALKNLVTDGETGFIFNLSKLPYSLDTAIESIENSDTYLEISENCVRLYNEKFQEETMTAKTLSLYHKLLEINRQENKNNFH